MENVEYRYNYDRADDISSPHVLLIEDNDFVRQSESIILERAGFDVTPADDGIEGIQLFKLFDECVDLVITDYDMPGYNGDVVRERLSELDPLTPVILVTGNPAGIDEQTLTEFDAVLTKPVQPHLLTETAQALAIM